MIVREIYPYEWQIFNQIVNHPLQSWQWGEFRQKTGLKVKRLGVFEKDKLKLALQLTIHPLPKTDYALGYAPKCLLPNQALLNALKSLAQEEKLIFIKFEPQSISGQKIFLENNCLPGRPLFTKYTFQIDLKKGEEELLRAMKAKTRYNIKIAQKNQVKVKEDNSPSAFKEYLKLTFETTKRQKFYAHDQNYHQLMWQTLYPAGIAHLLTAQYQKEILVAWILFNFHQTLYYPYGASSRKHKNVMASTLMMWEAIKFGQKLGCHTFDLWGSLGPNPNPKDPWFGFHRFKAGFAPKLIEFIGTYDLVIKPFLYKLYNFADNLRWKFLKLKTFFF